MECDNGEDAVRKQMARGSSEEDAQRDKVLFVSDETRELGEGPSTGVNFTESSSSKEASPMSDRSDEKASLSESGKTKRTIRKGQVDGDSGISMEKSGNSSEEDANKRQKTDENLDKATALNDDSAPKFHKLKSKVRKRNYRVKSNGTGDIVEDSCEIDTSGPIAEGSEADKAGSSRDQSSGGKPETVADENIDVESQDVDREELEGALEPNSDGPDQDDEEGDGSNEWTTASEDDCELEQGTPFVLKREKPKPEWFVVPEIFNRQLGHSQMFQRRFYGSLHSVQRLELMYKLNEHRGCVNTLNFNQRGNLLASASDDLSVIIWDWALGKKQHAFDSGHRSNVFSVKWLPLDAEHLIVTCARDGQIRLADINRGPTACSRKIAGHHGAVHKVSIHPDTPHIVLTAGEDAKVLSIDVRQHKPTKLLIVKEGSADVQLYSIHSNPLNSNEFCLGGRDQYVRVYDRRKLSAHVHKLCPEHLKTGGNNAHVTCAVYNYNGSEVLASYNDEDIYLFDTLIPHPSGDFAHRYQGHRNNATVKGVNYFGPKSEFVVSGSDCGNIYIWEKNSETIVQWMAGDEHGVVNVLEPHPHIPVLATSGLDYDVKVWVPSCEKPPSMDDLEIVVKNNLRTRAQDSSREPDAFDGQMLWILWRHIQQNERMRNRRTARGSAGRAEHRDDDNENSSSDNDTSNHSDSQSEGDEDRLQCSPS